MTYVPTGAFEIVKKLQHVEESTFGVTPNSATFALSAHGALLRETTTIRANHYRDLGSRDLYQLLKTGQLHSFELRYQPHSTALIRYGTELPNGSGTIDKALTMLYTGKVNGTESWFRHLGSRTDQIEIEVTEASVQVVQNFLCREIPAEVTSDPLTTPNYAGADTTAVWTGATPGSNPLVINSNNVDTPRFKVTVNWALEVGKPNGELLAKWIHPTNRSIAVEFDTWKKDGVLRADALSLTARAATYTLISGKTIGLTDLYLERYSKSYDANATAHQLETLAGTAKSLTVTA